jgi:hypothetical protein
MKRFLVFWDSGNDQQGFAEGYADEAAAHPKKINKQLETKLVDVSGSDRDRHFWAATGVLDRARLKKPTRRSDLGFCIDLGSWDYAYGPVQERADRKPKSNRGGSKQTRC